MSPTCLPNGTCLGQGAWAGRPGEGEGGLSNNRSVSQKRGSHVLEVFSDLDYFLPPSTFHLCPAAAQPVMGLETRGLLCPKPLPLPEAAQVVWRAPKALDRPGGRASTGPLLPLPIGANVKFLAQGLGH